MWISSSQVIVVEFLCLLVYISDILIMLPICDLHSVLISWFVYCLHVPFLDSTHLCWPIMKMASVWNTNMNYNGNAIWIIWGHWSHKWEGWKILSNIFSPSVHFFEDLFSLHLIVFLQIKYNKSCCIIIGLMNIYIKLLGLIII